MINNTRKENMKLVSVLMTSYNREKYIAEAMESVLSSTYENLELIIVDDGSTDNTVNIAREYENKDQRVRVYINQKNLGDYANRNKAASYAVGEYIKYLDSDDSIFPWGIEYCVEMMEKFPDAGMGLIYLKDKLKDEYLKPKDTIKRNFFESTILNIGPGGTILRRSIFNQVGGYDAIYGPASDMYFNLKMASNYPVVLLKKEFFYYRIHDGQELNNRFRYLCYNYKYLNDAFNLPSFPLEEKEKKYLLKKAEFYYIKDFFVFVKNTGKIKKAFTALKISGMGFKNLCRGTWNLILSKIGKTRYKPLSN